MPKILLTGGAGYIGSHTAVALLNHGLNVTVIDNLSNSSKQSLVRAQEITGKEITFFEGDVRCEKTLQNVFEIEKIDGVIHFAGLKAVGESVQKPLAYYDNNFQSTLNLLKVMNEEGVNNLVFSSSATVYHDESVTEYDEATTKTDRPASPYGTTKLMQEWVLEDTVNGDEFENPLKCIALRYFNPVGAHSSGLIGEDPEGIPNNLTPFITQVAIGRREKLSVFGNDYPTPDGTCIRDYIHIEDLAKGHLLAVNYLLGLENKAYFDKVNLGSGKGNSVLEVISAFENAIGKEIPYEIIGRRAGDLPEYYAKAEKAKRMLGFQTEKSLGDMAVDAWCWQKNNPHGYEN